MGNGLWGGYPARSISTTPPLSRWTKYHSVNYDEPSTNLQQPSPRRQQQQGFSFFVACCFAVNYVMGCGFLGIPWAFQEAGIFTSVVLLVVVSWLANMSKDQLLVTMARAEALSRATLQPWEVDPVPAITRRKFEISEMCGIFGKAPLYKVLYTALLSLYMFTSLWAYGAVFASSLAAYIPMPFLGLDSDALCDFEPTEDDKTDPGAFPSPACRSLYVAWLLFFGVISVTLSCLELTEQVPWQILTAVLRLATTAAMAASALYSTSFPPSEDDALAHRGSPHLWIRWVGIPRLVPVLVFAQIFHHSLPVLSQPVRDKDRLHHIFSVVFAVTGSVYGLFGGMLAWFFGSEIEQSCNLNWDGFRGGAALDAPTPLWAGGMSLFIVLFPAVDVMSAFPLNAITLGNNILSAVVQEKVAKSEKRRSLRVLCRLVAALPPLITALFVRDLGVLLDFAGVIGIAICFVVPPLLLLSSDKAMTTRWPRHPDALTTPYSSTFTSPAAAKALLVGGAGFVLYMVLKTIVTTIGR